MYIFIHTYICIHMYAYTYSLIPTTHIYMYITVIGPLVGSVLLLSQKSKHIHPYIYIHRCMHICSIVKVNYRYIVASSS